MNGATGTIGGAAETAVAADRPDVVHTHTQTLRIDRESVLAFQRATGAPLRADHVPLTYPVGFLARPGVRHLIDSMISGKGIVPVHEAQSFVYLRELELETDYRLDVELSCSQKPPRLRLVATVATADAAEPCVRIETLLRLVPLDPDGFGPDRSKAIGV